MLDGVNANVARDEPTILMLKVDAAGVKVGWMDELNRAPPNRVRSKLKNGAEIVRERGLGNPIDMSFAFQRGRYYRHGRY